MTSGPISTEEGQVDGVTKLYEHIKVASPTLLAKNAEWMEQYSGEQKGTRSWWQGRVAVNQGGVRRDLVISASSFDDSLMDDCN